MLRMMKNSVTHVRPSFFQVPTGSAFCVSGSTQAGYVNYWVVESRISLVAIKLCFLIPDTDKPWGSSLMRGNQLCEIARRHLGNRFDCATMKMPLLGLGQPLRSVNSVRQIAWMAACPLDAIYFVTKQCIEELNPISAEILKRRAQGVLFDYVDSNMAKVPMRDADIHLCASQAQYDYMTRKQRRVSPASVALLPHGYDCRVKRCAPATGAVQAIYWGALKNTHIPPAIAREIFVIDGEVAPSAKILDELSQYRVHYGVRIASSGAGKKIIFKPLTKAANAAACGANIIINRDAHDAVDLLGADYPYLVDATNDENIIEVFEHAKLGVDGSDWVKARGAMDALAAQLSPESIARQLALILRPLTE